MPTPLGSYNPDWAVLIERDGHERLYFVVETKSSLFDEDLRDREGGKIKCGTAHFKALAVGENPAVYGKFKDVEGLIVASRMIIGTLDEQIRALSVPVLHGLNGRSGLQG